MWRRSFMSAIFSRTFLSALTHARESQVHTHAPLVCALCKTRLKYKKPMRNELWDCSELLYCVYATAAFILLSDVISTLFKVAKFLIVLNWLFRKTAADVDRARRPWACETPVCGEKKLWSCLALSCADNWAYHFNPGDNASQLVQCIWVTLKLCKSSAISGRIILNNKKRERNLFYF